jgi:hypothetical protein
MKSPSRRRRRRLILATLFVALLVGSQSGAVARVKTLPLLGSSAFYAPHAKGFGTAHPSTISNGGDASGVVTEIVWKDWGGETAIGYGLNSIFKPNGGYYPRPVRIELRARHLGRCAGHLVYRQLRVRLPAKPGGPLGKWFLWSGAKSLCAKSP